MRESRGEVGMAEIGSRMGRGGEREDGAKEKGVTRMTEGERIRAGARVNVSGTQTDTRNEHSHSCTH